MWHEQKVRVQTALVLGRAVFIWQHMLINSENSWAWGWAPDSTSLAKAQEQCLAAVVIRAKHTKHKVSTSCLLLMGTEGWDVIFSMILVLVKSGRIKVGHCAKCVTQLTLPRLPWADLFGVWVSLWLWFIRSCVGGVALSLGQDWDSPCSASHRAAELIHPALITHQLMQDHCTFINTGWEWADIKHLCLAMTKP